jgi:ATP-dependent DNA helicase RecG
VRHVRAQVWSAGKYPNGITPESLTRAHLSVQRNPIIAEVFYRTGLIEKWGRGTNRVAEMCTAARIAPPEFEEITGAAVVTFRVPVAGAESGQSQGQSQGQSHWTAESSKRFVP